MKRLAMFVAIVFSFPLNSNAQWVQTNGPYGGYVTCFGVSGANLFAGTSGAGVFLSTNNGTSWAAVNSALSWLGLNVSALTANGTNLFAGTFDGVFRSTNNGANWTAVNTGLSVPFVKAFAVSGSNLFVGTYGGGVSVSTDNGTSWTAANAGLTNNKVLSLLVSGSRLFAGTQSGGVFLSTNAGTSWTQINSGITGNVNSLAVLDTNLFAGTEDSVFLSTNNGTSWRGANSGLPNRRVRAFAVSGSNLFVGTYGGGVSRTTNLGTSWTVVNTGMKDQYVLSLLANGTDIFAGGQGKGVFLSADSGTSWAAMNSGLSAAEVRSLTVSGGNLLAGVVNGGLFLSTNNGINWNSVESSSYNTFTPTCFAEIGPNLFMGGNDMLLSTDHGVSWRQLNSRLSGEVNSFAVSGSNLFAGTDSPSGVSVSTDNGSSWTAVNNGLPNIAVRVVSVRGTRIFAGLAFGGIYFSTDNGQNWTTTNAGSNLDVYSLAAIGANVFAGTGNGVFVSTDSGATWRATGFAPPGGIVSSFAVSGTNLFAGTYPSGVFFSSDNGASWTAVNPGLTSAGLPVSSLTLSGTNLFAGTDAGVFVARVESIVPPATPRGLLVTDSSSKTITIRWKRNGEPDFLRYRIYRGLSPSPTTKVDSTTGGVLDTSKSATGLVNGVRYFFRVTAIDSSGNESGYSNEVNAVPNDRVAPAAPQNLAVTDSTSTKIGIKWRKNTDADFLRYRIYRGTTAAPTTKVDSTTGGISDTSKTFTGLVNGTRYYFRVTAVDSSGNESAYSNEVSGVPNASVSVEDIYSQIPKEYSLSQNYPNPFNPNTTLRYALPEPSRVKLEIYDLLGRVVTTLVNGEQEASYYEMNWQANVPSGIYFYRMVATAVNDPSKSFVQVRKMILLK